ncbi:MAG: radical SAM protein [candidate division KSB1 bacterium]|nr:radical SAM protein [candidate division KSB1 bacterium]MDZ7276004.1 radical SAM protein [candidate division KSB1 bacterium]MDZ7285714.1 radical SAM protein [candidate division KSB1 bacterium]MDZ7298746.1 radical SAM protein [candidate division KSB1 bacterium]MDZ7305929.1 radical SAM protein [candidate division KSB1 bacterium]
MLKQVKHLQNLLRFARGEHEPIIGPIKAVWEVLYICNARCRTCECWQQAPDEEVLSTAEGMDLIRQLAENGVMSLCFTGGEPLLRKDIFELIACAKRHHLSTALMSNGLLINERRAKKLIDAGLDLIYISLDGSTPELNDSLRGIKGYFDLASQAIENLKALRSNARPKIYVAFTINKANLYDLENMARFVKKRALEGLSFQPALHRPAVRYRVDEDLALGPGDAARLQAMVDRVLKMYGELLPMNRDYYRQFASLTEQPDRLWQQHSVAGFAFASIDPRGNIYPDPLQTELMGNIREQRFDEIWYGRRAREVRGRIARQEVPAGFFESVVPLTLAVQRMSPLRLHRALKPILTLAQHF